MLAIMGDQKKDYQPKKEKVFVCLQFCMYVYRSSLAKNITSFHKRNNISNKLQFLCNSYIKHNNHLVFFCFILLYLRPTSVEASFGYLIIRAPSLTKVGPVKLGEKKSVSKIKIRQKKKTNVPAAGICVHHLILNILFLLTWRILWASPVLFYD